MHIITYETENGIIQNNLLEALESIFTKIIPKILLKVDSAPVELSITFKEWNGVKDLNSVALDALKNAISDCGILIGTITGSKFHKWCQDQCPHAEWGCSAGIISVDYSPKHARLSNQLHECLHFFNVNDCYEIKNGRAVPKPSCNNEACIMRYGVVSKTVCDNVLLQLKAWANQRMYSDAR